MDAQSQFSTEKPGMVQAIAIMTLANGILNIFASLIWTILIVVGTIGIGLICTPITLLPAVLGVFEILYGVNLMANPPKVTKPNQTIAILEIICIIFANVVSLVIGILALVFYNEDEVKAYFANLSQ